MYTTLATLKEARACIPGYTRMVSFFSTRAVMKDVEIPLFMIPLLGDPDDCVWAIANGVVFEPQAYARFRARHFPWALRNMMYRVYDNHTDRYGRSVTKPRLARTAITEFFDARSDEALIQWFHKWSICKYNHWLWNEVLDINWLYVPSLFVNYVLEQMGSVIQEDPLRALLRRDYAGVEAVSFDLGSQSDSSDEDENSDSEDEEDADDDEDTSPPRRFYKTPARRSTKPVMDHPKTLEQLKEERAREIGSLSNSGLHEKWKELGYSTAVCPFYNAKASLAYNMASLLCDDGDPYQKATEFIAKHDLAEKTNAKGFMLSKANDKEPPGYHLTLNLSDPRLIFTAFHMLKAQDLNVADLFGTGEKAEEVAQLLRNSDRGASGNSNCLENYNAVEVAGNLTLESR